MTLCENWQQNLNWVYIVNDFDEKIRKHYLVGKKVSLSA